MKAECMVQVTSLLSLTVDPSGGKGRGGGQVHNIWESHHWSCVIIGDDNPNRSFANNMTEYQFLLRAYCIYLVDNAEGFLLLYSFIVWGVL